VRRGETLGLTWGIEKWGGHGGCRGGVKSWLGGGAGANASYGCPGMRRKANQGLKELSG